MTDATAMNEAINMNSSMSTTMDEGLAINDVKGAMSDPANG